MGVGTIEFLLQRGALLVDSSVLLCDTEVFNNFEVRHII